MRCSPQRALRDTTAVLFAVVAHIACVPAETLPNDGDGGTTGAAGASAGRGGASGAAGDTNVAGTTGSGGANDSGGTTGAGAAGSAGVAARTCQSTGARSPPHRHNETCAHVAA